MEYSAPDGLSGGFNEAFLTDGDYTIDNLPADTYTVSITDKCGETVTETVVIEQFPEFEVTVEASDICFGETTGSIYVEWNNEATFLEYSAPDGLSGGFNEAFLTDGDYTIDNLPADTYTVSITDKCGETVTETVVIEQFPEFAITVEASDICFEKQLAAFTWSGITRQLSWNIVHQVV